MDFSEKLLALQKAEGLTQEQLAESLMFPDRRSQSGS